MERGVLPCLLLLQHLTLGVLGNFGSHTSVCTVLGSLSSVAGRGLKNGRCSRCLKWIDDRTSSQECSFIWFFFMMNAYQD